MCVSVHVLSTTLELKCVNVLPVVAFATPSMVTVPQVPILPAPMLLVASAPFVAVTLVTSEVILMAPQLAPLKPLPIPAALSPPVASTVPPEMLMATQLAPS